MADKPANKKNTVSDGNKYQIPGALDYRDKVYLKQNAGRRTAGSVRTSGVKAAGTRPAGHSADIGKSSGRRRRKKTGSVGVLLGILCGSLGVIFMLILVLMVQFTGNTDKKGQEGSKESTAAAEPFVKEEKPEYISINGDSCTVYLGQQFQLTVSSYPAELADSVVWSSNNEAVAFVDESGNVRIVGEGIAAITATSGSYADAIAIEALADSMADASMGFPLYSRTDVPGQSGIPNPVTPTPGTSLGDGAGDSQVNQGESRYDEHNGGSQSDRQDNSPDGSGSAAVSPGNQENTGAAGGERPTAQEPPRQDGANPQEQDPGQQAEQPTGKQEEPTQPYIPPETEPTPDIDTAEMFSVLNSSGFAQYLSNACIYEKNGEYQGEVIVAADSVHIYIKERSAEFDQAIKGALAYLLPDTSDTVWNSYVAATSDRTISSGGRKVRFVMAAVDAHSQIIVYNP